MVKFIVMVVVIEMIILVLTTVKDQFASFYYSGQYGRANRGPGRDWRPPCLQARHVHRHICYQRTRQHLHVASSFEESLQALEYSKKLHLLDTESCSSRLPAGVFQYSIRPGLARSRTVYIRRNYVPYFVASSDLLASGHCVAVFGFNVSSSYWRDGVSFIIRHKNSYFKSILYYAVHLNEWSFGRLCCLSQLDHCLPSGSPESHASLKV